MVNRKVLSQKVIERLCRYRKFLLEFRERGTTKIFSYELAKAINASPEQVRRDMMILSLSGTSKFGYDVDEFLGEITRVTAADEKFNACLVGVGNLGKAILSYFARRKTNAHIVAAFDEDVEKVERVLSGCPTYHVREMSQKIPSMGITLAVMTAPASVAQQLADELFTLGIRGILNFAPVRLEVPSHVHLENVDITLAFEKTAYFSKYTTPARKRS